MQVAVELGQGQAAVRSVGQQILQDELGSCHLRVGVPSRQAGPASRLAREPIASLSAFLRKAAAGKVGKYNPDGGGCMHGAGCAPACQARATRQVHFLQSCTRNLWHPALEGIADSWGCSTTAAACAGLERPVWLLPAHSHARRHIQRPGGRCCPPAAPAHRHTAPDRCALPTCAAALGASAG